MLYYCTFIIIYNVKNVTRLNDIDVSVINKFYRFVSLIILFKKT